MKAEILNTKIEALKVQAEGLQDRIQAGTLAALSIQERAQYLELITQEYKHIVQTLEDITKQYKIEKLPKEQLMRFCSAYAAVNEAEEVLMAEYHQIEATVKVQQYFRSSGIKPAQPAQAGRPKADLSKHLKDFLNSNCDNETAAKLVERIKADPNLNTKNKWYFYCLVAALRELEYIDILSFPQKESFAALCNEFGYICSEDTYTNHIAEMRNDWEIWIDKHRTKVEQIKKVLQE